jgi:hypothetical protein
MMTKKKSQSKRYQQIDTSFLQFDRQLAYFFFLHFFCFSLNPKILDKNNPSSPYIFTLAFSCKRYRAYLCPIAISQLPPDDASFNPTIQRADGALIRGRKPYLTAYKSI